MLQRTDFFAQHQENSVYIYNQYAGAVHQCYKRSAGFTCDRTNVFQGIVINWFNFCQQLVSN